jgi:hypothetical protein
MKKATMNAFRALLFSIVLSGMAVAQPTIDGSSSGDTDYILLAEWTQANTGFGDHGITELLAYTDATDLYIMVVGEIESNFNELYVFIGVSTESNVSAGTQLPTGSDGSSPFNSFNPTLDFDASFGIRLTSGNSSNAFSSIIDYRSAGNTDTFLTTIANDGTASTISSGTYTGVDVAYDDTGNLTSNTGVEGFEISIPLSVIGADGNSDAIKLMAMYGADDFISANTIPEISGQSGTNLGTDPDFDGISSDQHSNFAYVEIDGNDGWRLLSFPVDNPTVETVSDDTPVQGVTGGDDAGAATNFYLNTGTDSETQGSGYVAPTNTTTAIDEGLGYALYFYDNTSNSSEELPIILDAIGAEPADTAKVTLGHTWTLAGNPYSSNIQMSGVKGNDSGAGVSGTDGLKGTVRLYDDNTGNFIGVAYSSAILSPWQGFFIERNSSSTTELFFPPEAKTSTAHTNQEFAKVAAQAFRQIDLVLDAPENFGDTGTLFFHDISGPEDDAYDATKLASLDGAPSFSFVLGDKLVQQESRAFDLESEQTYMLDLSDAGVEGEYTMSWPTFTNVPGEWEIIFTDYETSTSLNMREVDSYTFEVVAQQKRIAKSVLSLPQVVTQSSADNNRFGITITPTLVSNETEDGPLAFALDQNYPNPFNPSTSINYTMNEAGVVNISVYNLMGQKVATLVDETKSAGQHNVRWNAANVSSGMYYYRLEANGQAITRKMTLIK